MVCKPSSISFRSLTIFLSSWPSSSQTCREGAGRCSFCSCPGLQLQDMAWHWKAEVWCQCSHTIDDSVSSRSSLLSSSAYTKIAGDFLFIFLFLFFGYYERTYFQISSWWPSGTKSSESFNVPTKNEEFPSKSRTNVSLVLCTRNADAYTVLDFKYWLITRDDSQRRFSAQQSIATLVQHCLELSQHCSSIVALKIAIANRSL